MRHEHAITYQGRPTSADLEYIVQKANKLGNRGERILRVQEEKDYEGTHVFFDVIGAYEQKRSNGAI